VTSNGKNMSNPTTSRDLTFNCYRNGCQQTLGFVDAHRLLWTSTLGYLVKPSWYRYRFGENTREFFLRDIRVGELNEKICRGDQEFLFALHAHRCVPVTREDLYDPSYHHKPVKRSNFIKRRSRLGGIFPKDLCSIERVDTLDDAGRARLGYMFRRGITWLMIVGVECSGVFDWTAFFTPPTRALRPTA